VHIEEDTRDRIPALQNKENRYIISNYVKCYKEKCNNERLECLEFPKHKVRTIVPPPAAVMRIKYNPCRISGTILGAQYVPNTC
jgi:hypothetical protein